MSAPIEIRPAPALALLIARRGDHVVGYACGRLKPQYWNQLLDAYASMQDLWI